MSPHENLRVVMKDLGDFPKRPESFLEVGTGWGQYGFLLRSYWDAAWGRFQPEDWQTKIDGIEVCERYICDAARLVYDDLQIGNALDILPGIPDNSYDVTFSIEVLEHFEEADGHAFIDHLKRIARLGVVISTPHPDGWEAQGSLFGNDYEIHRTVWSPEQMEALGFVAHDVRPSVVYQWQKPAEMKTVGIGVVTYNRLDLLEKCFPTWRDVPNAVLAVFDNDSDRLTRSWLATQPIDATILSSKNAGAWIGRNRLVEYFRDYHAEIEYVLLPDSDVELLPGAVADMLRTAEMYPDAGFAAWPQANKGFPISTDGYVEEVASECNLTRMAMWRDIKYPESLVYYSGDSWASTMANMLGWRTVLVQGCGDGYIHHAHGSQGNAGVSEVAERDVQRWQVVEGVMAEYWRHRFEHGKGFQPGEV